MMKALIKKVFTLPDFGEEQDGQRAYLLHVILWGLIVMPIPYVLFAIIFTPQNAAWILLQGGISSNFHNQPAERNQRSCPCADVSP